MEYVTLCDLDWLEDKNRLPNMICLQLSSYLKQKGMKINFATTAHEYRFTTDRYYVFRESENTPIPPYVNTSADNVCLLGKGFRYYERHKTLMPEIVGVRPDYLLYQSQNKKFSNADFVQYFYGSKLVKNRQDFHNTAHGKKFTIVMDRNLWKQSESDLLWALEDMVKEKNIMFACPIGLRRLAYDEALSAAFCKLHFTPGTIFEWSPDCDEADVAAIHMFLQQVAATTRSSLGSVPFYAEKEGLSVEENVRRCFNIVAQFKQSKFNCHIVANKDVPFYKTLEYWTTTTPKLSYIEFTLHKQILSTGLSWSEILNNSKFWGRSNMNSLIYMLTDDSWVNDRHTLFSQWGDKKLQQSEVNYTYLNKQRSLTYDGILY